MHENVIYLMAEFFGVLLCIPAPPFTSSLSYCAPAALGTHSPSTTHARSDRSDSQRKQESELTSSRS